MKLKKLIFNIDDFDRCKFLQNYRIFPISSEQVLSENTVILFGWSIISIWPHQTSLNNSQFVGLVMWDYLGAGDRLGTFTSEAKSPQKITINSCAQCSAALSFPCDVPQLSLNILSFVYIITITLWTLFPMGVPYLSPCLGVRATSKHLLSDNNHSSSYEFEQVLRIVNIYTFHVLHLV